MAADQGDTERLANLMQTPPQELYQEIERLTFTLDADTRVESCRSYEPPSILAVSRALRARLAPAFYSGSVFFTKRRQYLVRWLLFLSRAERAMVEEIEFWTTHRDRSVYVTATSLTDFCNDWGMTTVPSAILIDFWCSEHGRNEWAFVDEIEYIHRDQDESFSGYYCNVSENMRVFACLYIIK